MERLFRDIPTEKLDDEDQHTLMVAMGWSNATTWAELLQSKRILIVSEAGAGKTFECQTEQKRLWDAGEPAFFLELATLAKSDVRSMLSYDEEQRLEAWLVSQSDVATFFLDSIDELKLSLGSFEQALKRLSKTLAGQLNRVRIIITTRPVPFDRAAAQRLLAIPEPSDDKADGDSFARIVMHGRKDRNKQAGDKQPPDWREVALLPLSNAQIIAFATGHGVTDPDEMLADLQRRNAEAFARRPQDLLELCADWRDHKRIRTHQEQLATNIRLKLSPRLDRPEPAELSIAKAIDGASRLAVALTVTRRLTIRHSAEADAGEGAALEPSVILADWSAEERKALLERPLFGFASYGRVRFHHRSVLEYLAAERIKSLRAEGMSASALKRLIFATSHGQLIVRPSMRAVAGWLALTETMVFELLRDHEPAVLINHGDPESLTVSQRVHTLRSYAERYGMGGWRGLRVPAIQIHRLASKELSDELNRLADAKIENPEVRELLLDLVEAGRITECAGIALAAVENLVASNMERVKAIDALIQLNHPSLRDISARVTSDTTLWPDSLARAAVSRLFPVYMTPEQMCAALERLQDRPKTIGDLSWQIPRIISEAELSFGQLVSLRDTLSHLVRKGLRWGDDHWPKVLAERPELGNALAATCKRGLEIEVTDAWIAASVLALRLPSKDHDEDDHTALLRAEFRKADAELNELLFWADDALISSLHKTDDPWNRYALVGLHGAALIDDARDREWVFRTVADRSRPLDERALLLEPAMRMPLDAALWRDHLVEMKQLVADSPELLARIDERLSAPDYLEQEKHWQAEQAVREAERAKQEAADHQSWVDFWQEIADNPEAVFTEDRSENTVWNLWQAMSRAGEDSRESGWNRRFIEKNFGKPTADRLRLSLMNWWRKDNPTLPSERPDDQRGTYLTRWQLGLAAIYAEAEDANWAKALSPEDVKLACRYAPINLSGLPRWIDALILSHPKEIDEVLGAELSADLDAKVGVQWHSMLLQNIDHSGPAAVALFAPRLLGWLDAGGDRQAEGDDINGVSGRLNQILEALAKTGDETITAHIHAITEDRLKEILPRQISDIWLAQMLRVDAEAGIVALEARISGISASARSEAVSLLGSLFGRHGGRIAVNDPPYTPKLLLRLLRLTYGHVKVGDDVQHEGSYTPDERDDAEHARNMILSALLQAEGPDAWAAKLEMIDDPLFAHFKDRVRAIAEEKAAEELDSMAMTDGQAVALDRSGEAPPTTNEAMFEIMLARLDDLDDLLLRDISPRQAWAKLNDEKLMRREIARALIELERGIYKIDQEAVTADEKETDIRFRSTVSGIEGIVELKLADARPARDLRDTIKDQLVTKYMAARGSRSGCLLITIAKHRSWDHPDTDAKLSFDELLIFLRGEADRVMGELGADLRLHVQGMDLRPRLPTEAKANSSKLEEDSASGGN